MFYHYSFWKILDIADRYWEIRGAIENGKAVNIAEEGSEIQKKFIPHDPMSALDAVMDFDMAREATGIHTVKNEWQAKKLCKWLNRR